MRTRFQVSLYTEYETEAEIIDYLTSFDIRKRQEILRTLIKAGYSSMVKHKNSSASMLSSVDPDVLNALMQQLMVNGAGVDTGYQRSKEEPENNGYTHPNLINGSPVKKEKKKKSKTRDVENPVVKKIVQDSISSDKNSFNTNYDLNNDDEFLDEDPSIYIDDDMDIDDDEDIIDPLAALMSKMN
jgi:hypothetical protein